MIKTITLDYKADGQELTFKNIPMKDGVYSTKEYQLEITQGDFTKTVLTRIDQKEFLLERASYSFGFDLYNPSKIIVPDTGRHFMDTLYPRQVMAKAKFLSSAAKMATPFMAFLDSTEKVKLAFGLTGKMVDSEFILESPGANGKYSLVVESDQWQWKINRPFDKNLTLGKTKAYTDGFYISTGNHSWFHALKEYGEIYRQANEIELRPNTNTYDTEFCTWRVTNPDNFTHEWTIETAKECKKLGIDAMILDDGWSGVGLDSDIMESSLGDWPRKVDGKYDDIAETIEAIKNEGIKPLLWFCPLGLGPQSADYEKFQKYCVETNGVPYVTPGLFRTLCPRNPQARTVMVQMLRRILSYNPSGFKPDLFNYMPIEACTADHEHDIPNTLQGLKECMRLMYEEATKHDPEMIFMLKNDEASVEFSQFAPAVRSGDSPYDPNIMFLRCAYANAIAPIVINDYLMIGKNESQIEIAHSLIKQLTMGVPAISIDLLNASEKHKAVLKVWIDLYNSTIKDIHKNAAPMPQDSALHCWERIDQKNNQALISLVHPTNTIQRLPATKEIIILNATEYEKIFINEHAISAEWNVQTYNYMHQKQTEYLLGKEDCLIEIPSAGFAVLKQVDCT